MRFFILILGLINLAKSSELADFPGSADEVKSLPGLKSPTKFRQYSGYLNASEGRYLFYWFIESQNSTKNDPIVQWIAGGPGGSSVMNMLTGLGPWRVTGNGTKLVDNPRSWNKFANLLVIDSPVGVGFSYETNSSYVHDDDTTAKDMLLALKSFFKKFPHFKSNEFYLTGVSYAGIYIPHLSRDIVRNNQATKTDKINLKGVAIANGAVNGLERHAITSLYVEYNNGMISRESWIQLHEACGCGSFQKVNQFCNFFKSKSKLCHGNLTQIFNGKYTPIYIYVAHKYNISYNFYEAIFKTPPLINAYQLYKPIKYCQRPKDDYLKNIFDFYEHSLDGPNMLAENDCIDSISLGRFITNPKVAKALNARKKFGSLNFTLDCFGPYKKGCTYKLYEGSFDDMFKELIRSQQLNKIIIYNGDWDLICDYLSSEWFLERLALPVKQDYRQWIVGNRVVGFTRKYVHGVNYATVRGTGHSARLDEPGVIELITKFMISKSD